MSTTATGRLPPGAMAIAILAVGIIGLAAAMPAASADRAAIRDDNKWGQCPNGFLLDYTFGWPVPEDKNGNWFICYLPA